MRLFLTALVFGFTPVFVLANQAELTPNDFANGHPIQFTPGQSLYEADLSEDVYRAALGPDLGDLRVFNGQSEVVGHLIKPMENQLLEEKAVLEIPLTFFPIYSAQEASQPLPNIKAEVSENGAVVEIMTEQDDQPSENSKRVAYLLDLSQVEEKIHGFKLKVDTSDEKGYFRKLKLESSPDLQTWTTLDPAIAIAKLSFGDEVFEQNEISLRSGKAKYYRLSWPESSEELQLSAISALHEKKAKYASPNLIWTTAEGATQNQEKGLYYYDLKAFFPVREIKVRFPQANSMARVSVSSKNQEKESWQMRTTKMLYTVSQNDATLEDLTISLPPKRARYWKMEILSNLEAIGQEVPAIDLGWSPEKIRFLARGPQPFLLAFGSAKAAPYQGMDFPDTEWSKVVAPAMLEKKKTLGGREALIQPAEPSQTWKTWILWAVLIGGVFSLIFMANRLLKTMKTESDS